MPDYTVQVHAVRSGYCDSLIDTLVFDPKANTATIYYADGGSAAMPFYSRDRQLKLDLDGNGSVEEDFSFMHNDAG